MHTINDYIVSHNTVVLPVLCTGTSECKRRRDWINIASTLPPLVWCGTNWKSRANTLWVSAGGTKRVFNHMCFSPPLHRQLIVWWTMRWILRLFCKDKLLCCRRTLKEQAHQPCLLKTSSPSTSFTTLWFSRESNCNQITFSANIIRTC